ncbi:hypothetical protein WBJ53_04830 [Spirosoma sp. SC4-14]|uniref:hypothetical protein n=1 Tax=Spirosoma sp. SC4-14 TaxID=3128900 RepID=UPI0030D0B277
MENQHASAPISPLELNQRQLAAWQELKQQLVAANPDDSRIGYCDRRIANIEAEIVRLGE